MVVGGAINLHSYNTIQPHLGLHKNPLGSVPLDVTIVLNDDGGVFKWIVFCYGVVSFVLVSQASSRSGSDSISMFCFGIIYVSWCYTNASVLSWCSSLLLFWMVFVIVLSFGLLSGVDMVHILDDCHWLMCCNNLMWLYMTLRLGVFL